MCIKSNVHAYMDIPDVSNLIQYQLALILQVFKLN